MTSSDDRYDADGDLLHDQLKSIPLSADITTSAGLTQSLLNIEKAAVQAALFNVFGVGGVTVTRGEDTTGFTTLSIAHDVSTDTFVTKSSTLSALPAVDGTNIAAIAAKLNEVIALLQAPAAV